MSAALWGRRSAVAVSATRLGAWLTLAGAALSPPLAVLGSLLMVTAFACVPDAGARLRRVLAEPLGRGCCALLAALALAAAIGVWRNGAGPAMHALLDWRQLLLVPVALAVFDDARARSRFALGLVALGVAGALVSLAATELGFSRNPQFAGVVLRNHVTQSLFVAIAALAAALLAATARQWRRPLRAAFALTALLLAADVLWLQAGRSGLLALLVAAPVALFALLPRRMRIVALLLVALAAAGAALVPNVQQRFGQGLAELRAADRQPLYTSMGIRTVIWRSDLALIERHPWLGYGLGGFAPAYAAHIATRYASGWQAMPVEDPHNQYLFLWIEAGAAGLAAFLCLLAGAWRQRGEDPWGALGLGLLAAWCVNSLFTSHFQTFSEAHMIAVLLGALLARTPAPAPARIP